MYSSSTVCLSYDPHLDLANDRPASENLSVLLRLTCPFNVIHPSLVFLPLYNTVQYPRTTFRP